MNAYYIDIETTGLNPEKEEIVTIQIQKIAIDTGRPLGSLNILPSWEYGEEAIVKETAAQIMTQNPWDCILVGNNLLFDFRFLVNKINKYQNTGIALEYFISRPHIDIKPIMIFANGGRFKGCHLVLNKSSNGALIPQWYKTKQYSEILNYIKEEAAAFCEFYQKAHKMICYDNNSRLDEYV